jgi:hypothetical protein
LDLNDNRTSKNALSRRHSLHESKAARESREHFAREGIRLIQMRERNGMAR